MRTRYGTTDVAVTAAGSPSPQRIRWGAVFGGAVLGLALLALLTTLWFALGYGSGQDSIRDNIEWYVGLSAVASLFIAGMLAGWLSGVRGAGSGFFNGVTIWAMMLVLTIFVGVPAIMNVFNLGRIAALDASATTGLLGGEQDTVLWASFFAILGGLLASGIGGMIGGALTRPANAHLYDDEVVTRTDVDDRPTRPDVDDRRTVVVEDDDATTVRRAS
jgi:hypothetical protein